MQTQTLVFNAIAEGLFKPLDDEGRGPCFTSDYYRLEDKFEEPARVLGFTVLGAGAFSCVFESPAHPDIVLKLVTNPHDGYHMFLDFLSSDEFAALPESVKEACPKIISDTLYLGVRVVYLEKLVPGDMEDKAHYDARTNVQKGACGYDGYSGPYFEIGAALRKWRGTSNVAFDLHSGNFMVRPSTGQLVLTDPFGLIGSWKCRDSTSAASTGTYGSGSSAPLT